MLQENNLTHVEEPVDKSVDNIEDIYPMTNIEKGMIYHSLRDDGNDVYHNQMVYYMIDDQFEEERLHKTLRLLTAKHHILRTGFKMDDEFDEPVQIVYKQFHPRYRHYDLSRMGKAEQEDYIKSVLREDRRKAFDISAVEPLWRVKTFALDAKNICFTLSMHHSIIDGWSSATLLTELANTYLRLKIEPHFVPAPLASSYKEFVIEQLVLKNRPETAQFWKDELAGYNRFNILERVGSEDNKNDGKKNRDIFYLQPGTLEKLRKIAGDYNTSLRNLCFAAYVYMLHMISYQDDLVAGFIVNNRPACADGDKIVGCFLNTVPVRVKIPQSLTWRDYITHVEDKIRQLSKYNRLSFFDIVDAIGEKNRNENPVVDTIFNFVDFYVVGGLNQETRDINMNRDTDGLLDIQSTGDSSTVFDFSVETTMGKLSATVYYSNLIPRIWVKRLAAYFENVLDQFIYAPHAPASKEELLAPGEKQEILYRLNETRTSYPREKTIHRLFQEQCLKYPDRIAVTGKNRCAAPLDHQHLTYRRLNEISQRLAHVLRGRGVGPDTIVGLIMERSVEMIIAIFGILKAGGAYLPIEPHTPSNRVFSMLDDCNSTILLTEKSLAPSLETSSYDTLIMEELDHICSSGPLTPIDDQTPSSALSYVIYTSGSTGKPKGVLTRHYNVTRVVKDTNYIDIGPLDKVLQLSNYAFDGSVFDIYGALLNGSSLLLLAPGVASDAERLATLIKKENVTLFFLTTALFNTLVDLRIDFLDPIRKILFGGERVSVDHTRRALQYAGPGKIIHVYGPTETTVYASYYHIDRIPPDAATIPIGKPLANTTLYVLDSNLNLLPKGAVGELYIGGEGSARGYLNRLQLTLERFIPNPFVPNDRLYKTGDLVYWDDNGDIVFCGRNDDQVKIRGFRIEPAETQAHLISFEGISEAIVIPYRSKAAGGRADNVTSLCAYYVAQREISTEEIKEHLALKLPPYMIPSYFIPLQKMPLNPNGKIDRKALPAPLVENRAQYTPPTGETQVKLAQIWSGILALDAPIGRTGNFFEIGGHSLNATVLASRIHKELNIEIPLSKIFQFPQLDQLAAFIDNLDNLDNSSPGKKYTAIEPAEEKEYYILSSAQKRLYILQQLDKSSTIYNIPLVVTLEGSVDLDKIKEVFLQLVKRHESFRTSFKLLNNEPVQVIHEEAQIGIDIIQPLPGEEEENRARPDIHKIVARFVRPFDLSQPPLLRVGVIPIEETKYILMLDMHHIITDGGSNSVIFQEIAALYEGNELPAPRIYYKEFSQWQDRQRQTGVIKQQEEFWLKQFEDKIPLLNLTTDYPRPVVQDFEGRHVSFDLGTQETRLLKNLAADTGLTLYMVLLSAFYIFLAKLSGDQDIVVGTPIAGRRHADIQNTVGMFVNMLALRNYPAAHKTCNQFMAELKERTLKSFENQECQFEELVEKLSVPRDAGRNPLFDTMFVLQTTGAWEKEIPHLKLTPFPFDNLVSKFDLTLVAVEAQEQLQFTFEYAAKLFHPDTIKRFITYFKNIVREMAPDPHLKISQLQILTGEERNRVLYDFNASQHPFPQSKTIHQLFEERAREMPDNIALSGPSCFPAAPACSLTYKELNNRAGRLSRTLTRKGVRPGSIVSLVAGRSVEMIVAMLGILKAGAAYLPIDSQYPADRVRYMIEDSCSTLVAVQDTSKWEHSTGPAIVDLSDAHSYQEKNQIHEPGPTRPRDIAYVIYTSGSTGKPKGVLVEHRGIVTLSVFHKEKFEISHLDNIIQFASISFDASVWETYMALLNGSHLHVLSEETIGSSDYFHRYLDSRQITAATLPPEYAVHLDPLRLTSLRLLVTAGSAPTPQMIENWKERVTYINAYGPTETSICATWEKVDKAVPYNRVTIGKPIHNTQVYILDAAMNPQPPGVPGELCISGAGVARGYLNRPLLTHEKFVPNPFLENLSLYKSGDLARWLDDGRVEFLGRIDHQVKVRGFRIELGEIERQLMSIDGIKAAAVILIKQKGTENLCAYFQAPEEIETPVIRETLAKMLPNYMIPAFFNRLDQLPLTNSGKIDRKALAAIGYNVEPGQDFVAPRSDTEKIVADTWKEILGLEQVGIYDNFFEIGGNSLKMIALNSKLNAALGREIPAAKFFEHVTVDAFVKYLDQEENGTHNTGITVQRSAGLKDVRNSRKRRRERRR